jgi:hypothetical protein
VTKMDKDNNGVPDRIDAMLRYIAGFSFISFVGIGILTETLDTSAVIALSTLGAALIGEEKALSLIGRERDTA